MQDNVSGQSSSTPDLHPTDCTPIWKKWAGRVALTKIDPKLVSPLTPRLEPVENAFGLVRYGKAVGLGGRDVQVRFDGELHAFDRDTGLCVASPWGLLGDWRIAPYEMPRYRGEAPLKYRKQIEESRAAGKITTRECEDLVERLFENGEYGELADLLGSLVAPAKQANGSANTEALPSRPRAKKKPAKH